MKTTINKNISISLTATIDGSRIEFNSASEDDWAGYSLDTTDGACIAESISYDGITIHNDALLRSWYLEDHEGWDAWDCKILLEEALSGADELYEEEKVWAQQEAIAAMIEEEGMDGFIEYGDFANAYHLILVMDGAELPDDSEAEALTPEEFAEAWGRYPDAITEDYTTLEIIV